jgi:hypothetical protein
LRYECFETGILDCGLGSAVFTVFDTAKVYEGCRDSQTKALEVLPRVKQIVEGRLSTHSLVIVGATLVPTFLYPPYNLTNSVMSDASMTVAGCHFLQSQLIAELSGCAPFQTEIDPIAINYLSFFTGMIFSPHSAVRHIAATVCVGLLKVIPRDKCCELANRFGSLSNIESLPVPDKLLLSLLVVVNHHAIPVSHFEPLFQFLKTCVRARTEIALVALAIMLHGFGIWNKCTRPNESLYRIILQGLLLQKMPPFLERELCKIACAEWKSFIELFPGLIGEIMNMQLGAQTIGQVRGIMKLYTDIALANMKICGGSAALAIAEIPERYPGLVELSQDMLVEHAKLFDFVEIQNDVCLIGTPEGAVVAFQGGKKWFREQLFDDAAVFTLSFGPNMKFAVGISREADCAHLFRVVAKRKWGQGRTIKKVALNLGFGHARLAVYWLSDEDFEVRIVE